MLGRPDTVNMDAGGTAVTTDTAGCVRTTGLVAAGMDC